MISEICGKKLRPNGVTPAIALVNPKNDRNVAMTIRAASCFGVKQIWFTGSRVSLDPEKNRRLPREERMKGYGDVDVYQHDYFFDRFDDSVTPVAVEVRQNAENLLTFEHPENALYIFGPEDGHLRSNIVQHCHRFVIIPTAHCVNLAAAVYLILYDRMLKRYLNGDEDLRAPNEYLTEDRLKWPGTFGGGA